MLLDDVGLSFCRFENFLYVKYGGEKRFGLEGCDALIPGLSTCDEPLISYHEVDCDYFLCAKESRFVSVNVLFLSMSLMLNFLSVRTPTLGSARRDSSWC